MHRSNTKLMRSTPSGRPYARDFKDLFSTLMGKKKEIMVTKFSQSNSMQDPEDCGRIVTTTTTTTFSMAREMAVSVCQKFLDARFLECSTDKESKSFKEKCLWQPTSKGVQILQRFVQKNGIIADVPRKLINSQLNRRRLAILERNEFTDELSRDRAMIELIFRHFANNFTTYINAEIGRNEIQSTENTGNVEDEKRRLFRRQTVQLSYSGHDIVLWLMDCCTIVDRTEPPEIASLFLQYGLIDFVEENIQMNFGSTQSFSSARSSFYHITEHGKLIAGWKDQVHPTSSKTTGSVSDVTLSNTATASERVLRETNVAKLRSILNNTALRSEFREFLCENFCEENLSFWLDCDEFRRNMQTVLQSSSKMRDALAMAYTIYNGFLAPGSPCELNLDHTLRHEIATQMTRPTTTNRLNLLGTLRDIAALFLRAQEQCFKLMAAVNLPFSSRLMPGLDPKVCPSSKMKSSLVSE